MADDAATAAQERVLAAVAAGDRAGTLPVRSDKLATELGVEHQALISTVNSLAGREVRARCRGGHMRRAGRTG